MSTLSTNLQVTDEITSPSLNSVANYFLLILNTNNVGGLNVDILQGLKTYKLTNDFQKLMNIKDY